jgi:hypothetical protein
MGNCCSSGTVLKYDIEKRKDVNNGQKQEQLVKKSAPTEDLIQPSHDITTKPQELHKNNIIKNSKQEPSEKSESDLILPSIVPVEFTPLESSVMVGMMDFKSFKVDSIPETPKRVLYIIIPYSNPFGRQRQKELLVETVDKLIALGDQMAEDNTCCDSLEIVVSQIVYDGQIGLSFNKHDILFNTEITNTLWSKENLINLGIRDVLLKTKEAEYFAFIDADVSFDNPAMLSKTIDLLEENQMQMVQMFSHAVLTGVEEQVPITSFAYQYHLQLAEGAKYIVISDDEGCNSGI